MDGLVYFYILHVRRRAEIRRMERREEFSSKERKRKGKKMKGTRRKKKKTNRKNLKPAREHIYKKINVFVYIENVTSLFCNLKIHI